MTAHPCLQVGAAYPIGWERLALIANIIHPAVNLEHEAAGCEVVRRWREHAAESEAFSEVLDMLAGEGWELSFGIVYVAAHRCVNTVEDAKDIIDGCEILQRGFPVELRAVAGPNTAVLPAGGLLIRCDPHQEVCPPRTLPAIVATEPGGVQRVVEDENELRLAVAAALGELAGSVEDQPNRPLRPGATDLPDTIRCLASKVRRRGYPIPCSVRAKLQTPGVWDLRDPEYAVRVISVSAAVWSGMSIEMGVVSVPLEHAALSTGVAGELSNRGHEIARELEGVQPR